MICSNCLNEIENDSKYCRLCGSSVALADGLDSSIKWVKVFDAFSDIDAQMYKANLEGAEIPVRVISNHDVFRITTGKLDVVSIFVPNTYYETALEIIDMINRSETGNDEEFQI